MIQRIRISRLNHGDSFVLVGNKQFVKIYYNNQLWFQSNSNMGDFDICTYLLTDDADEDIYVEQI